MKGEVGQEVLGIDTESVGAMIVAIAASLGLASAVWFRRERWWLWLTIAFGIAFAAGDTREIHQVNESRTGVAVIAAVLIVAYLLLAGLATLLVSRPARASWAVDPSPMA